MKPNLDKRSIALQTIGFLANNKTRVGTHHPKTNPRVLDGLHDCNNT
jgi:hypothetical protein